MTPLRTLPCLATVAAIATFTLACALPAPALAASSDADAKASKKQKSHTVRFVKNPNHETAAERERRLKRECKGMPNAGACLGYAD